MEKEQLKDDFLKNLLKAGETEKPRIDFTRLVMQDIQQLEAERARSPFWTWGNVMLGITGLVLLVLAYFAVSPFLGEMNLFGRIMAPERYAGYLNAILNSLQAFLSLIEFLRESSITLIVLLVIPSLYVLDLVLKRTGSRTYLFMF
jgi:hypothetical protein